MMYPIPRNMAIVPSVTTNEGRPREVTRIPLNAPAAAPVRMAKAIATSIGAPARTASPKTTLESARMLATEMSISRAMISSVIGRAISARSDAPAIACERLKVEAKLGKADAA